MSEARFVAAIKHDVKVLMENNPLLYCQLQYFLGIKQSNNMLCSTCLFIFIVTL